MRGIAFVGVEDRQSRNGFLGVRVYLDRDLEFALGFLQVVVQAIEAAEQKMVVHTVGLDLHDLLILLDGQLQHVVGTAAAGHVTEGSQVNATQEFMRLEIGGVALDDVLGFDDGVADATGLDVKLGQAGSEELGRRVGFNGQAIFFHGLVGQLTAAINRDLFFIHVRDRVMVVGSGAIQLTGRGLGWCDF